MMGVGGREVVKGTGWWFLVRNWWRFSFVIEVMGVDWLDTGCLQIHGGVMRG